MRLIKGFIFALAGLFIMITVLSLLIPSRVLVTRGVEVKAGKSRIFTEISILKNWKHWQPVFKSDSLQAKYGPDSSGINSYCEWTSNHKVNKLVVIALTENSVTVSLQREGENEVKNTITLLPLPDSSSVQVEWKALTQLKWYPWEKFYGIFIEKVTGQGYEEALNSLKTFVEVH